MKPISTDPAHIELRGTLLLAYSEFLRKVADGTDPHLVSPRNFVGAFLRSRSSVRGSARQFLATALFSLLRRRPRLLIQAAIILEPDAPRDSFGRLATLFSHQKEAALAICRWLIEDLEASPIDAVAHTEAAWKSALPMGLFGRDRDARPLPPGLMTFSSTLPDLIAGNPGPPLALEDRLGIELSLAVELVRRWRARFGEERLRALGHSLLAPAPLALRVNSRKMSREELLKRLRSAGLVADACPFSPVGVILREKRNLAQVKTVSEDCYEIQDEGSQLVALAVAPEFRWRVLDACAGAGGKALHLVSMPDAATIVYAHDLEPQRMEALEKRAKAVGARNIHILQPGEPAQKDPFDAVLIDAPCLGLGRLRREPTVLWWEDLDERIAAISAQQRSCIDDYAPLVKPGGILVYATCSFEPEETTALLDSHPLLAGNFVPDPLPGEFRHPRLASSLSPDGSQITLLPSEHGTDGFFIARYRRRT